MSARWFRFYDDAINDPKVQLLPLELFRAWVNMLCLASKGKGTLPPLSDIAFALRVNLDVAQGYLTSLVEAGLLEGDADSLRPHNWDQRQFVSDNSTGRVRKHRDEKRNVSLVECETLQKRPQIQSTEAETDKKPEPNGSGRAKANRGSRLPDDWQPSAKVAADALTILGGDAGRYDRECDKFRDHWRAASGANAIKANWDAAWRNWCRNAMERFGTGPPRGPANVAPFSQQPRNTAYEAAKRIRDSLAASADPDAPIRSGASGNDDRMLQTGQRGFGGASGDGDYFDARPIPARGY